MDRTSPSIMLVAILVVNLSVEAQPVYTVTSTGALEDFDPSIPTPATSAARAINRLGAATGNSWINGGCIETDPGVFVCESVINHAFLWDDGALTELGEPIPGLEPLDYTSTGWAINDRNWIVGDYTTNIDFYYHAFLWRVGPDGLGQFVDLPSLMTGDARAWDVNNHGTVVGESDAEGTLTYHAVIWTREGGQWSAQDLGTFGGATSSAKGVNAHDEVTGFSMDGNRQTTFLYLPEPAYGLPAGMNDLTPDDSGTSGEDINAEGQVVGWVGSSPMVWLPEEDYGLPAGLTVFTPDQVATNETLEYLGAIQLLYAYFTAINDRGMASVEAWFLLPDEFGGTYQAQYGMVWFNGKFALLDPLIEPGTEWTRIAAATDINRSGQIPSTGVTIDDLYLGVVLTPQH